MPVDHVDRRVQPDFPEPDDDLAWSRYDVDGRGEAVESLGGHIQLVTPRSDVLGDDRRRADELPIDEHLRAGNIAVDAKNSGVRRRLGHRRRVGGRGRSDRSRRAAGRWFRSGRRRVTCAGRSIWRRRRSGGRYRRFAFRRIQEV